MAVLARMAGDPPQSLLDRIEGLGVVLARWAATDDDLAESNSDPAPRLYLVEPDAAPPPHWRAQDDWLRLPASSSELLTRAHAVLNKANRIAAVAHLDDLLLRIGGRLIILSRNEAALLRILLDRAGEVVPREDVEAAIWPDGPPAEPRRLDNPLKTLRKRLGNAPLRIHVLRQRGLLAELPPICAKPDI